MLPMQGAWVPPLVRELDPRAATKTLHATTKLLCNTGSPAWCSVMTHRSGVEGGGGGSRARGYIYIIMTDRAETNTAFKAIKKSRKNPACHN